MSLLASNLTWWVFLTGGQFCSMAFAMEELWNFVILQNQFQELLFTSYLLEVQIQGKSNPPLIYFSMLLMGLQGLLVTQGKKTAFYLHRFAI